MGRRRRSTECRRRMERKQRRKRRNSSRDLMELASSRGHRILTVLARRTDRRCKEDGGA
jgi:hypothetical protein